MDEHMVLKDHLIHLLTLNMDKYITTNKNTEASPDQPISHSHRHLLWAGQALPYGGKNNNKKKKHACHSSRIQVNLCAVGGLSVCAEIPLAKMCRSDSVNFSCQYSDVRKLLNNGPCTCTHSHSIMEVQCALLK